VVRVIPFASVWFCVTILKCFSNSFWKQTNGPLGGEIRSLSVKGDTIVAGAFYGGVYLSFNKGKVWSNVGLNEYRINSVVISNDKIYAGVGYFYENGGVFVTSDWGKSWKKILDEPVGSLYVSNKILLAGNFNNEMFASYDDGNNWSKIEYGGGRIYSIYVWNQQLFLGTEETGIFVSDDWGQTWEQKNNGLNNLNIWCIISKSDTLFIGTGGGGVFLSTNSGEEWFARNSGLLHPYVFSMLVLDGNIYAGTVGGGLYMSTNNGILWFRTNFSFESVECLGTDKKNIYAGTKGSGILVSSDNGDSWREINSGIIRTEISFLKAKGDTIFAGTSGNGIHISTNRGSSWMRIAYSITNPYVTSLVHRDSIIFAGTLGTGVFVSYNNGENWLPTVIKSKEVNTLCLIGDKLLVGTNYNGLFVVDIHSDSLIGNYFRGLSITKIVLFKDKIVVGTKSKGILLLDSSDYSRYWNFLTNEHISALSCNENLIFVGTDNGDLCVSTDGGFTWRLVISHSNGYVSDVVTDGDKVLVSWLSFEEGNWIISSIDNGESWGVRTEGLEHVKVSSLMIKDSLIYCGTIGFGVFKSRFDDIFSSVDDINFPDNKAETYFSGNVLFVRKLGQGFGESTPFKIVVFDILGKIVLEKEISSEIELIDLHHLPLGAYGVRYNQLFKMILKTN